MALGRVALEQGHVAPALDHLRPGLGLVMRHGDAFDQAGMLYHLADTSLAGGQHDHARAYAEEALALCSVTPGFFWRRLSHDLLGQLALQAGNVARARNHLLLALEQALEAEHKRSLSIVLADLGASLAGADAGEPELLQAARLWGAVDAHQEATAQRSSAPYRIRLDGHIQAARDRVAPARWLRAWQAGREQGMETMAVMSCQPQGLPGERC